MRAEIGVGSSGSSAGHTYQTAIRRLSFNKLFVVQGKAKATKASKVLQPSTSQNQAGKSIEEVYQKKSQLEHILLRPDTYIGSTEAQQQKLWVHDGEQLVLKDVEFVPGLYKIFDEILVNAADNKIRDPKMDTLHVDIDPVSNSNDAARLQV